MTKKMTSKERILAAVRCQDVDYVPMVLDLYAEPPFKHPRISWSNDRQRLSAYRDWGWDTRLSVNCEVTPLESVKTGRRYEPGTGDSDHLLCQIWDAPEGRLEEKLRSTRDWPESRDRKTNIPFRHDFRSPRYIEYPFKNENDLNTLGYLFPVDNPRDTDAIVQEYRNKRKLADEFNVPLFATMDAGLDWLVWLYPIEEAVLRLVSAPDFVRRLLTHINEAKKRRLDLLLELGIDGVVRRGWYESTDLWSPEIFREFARAEVEAEIEKVHGAGVPFIYIMMTGIMPLLADLAEMKFDCLNGAEPALGGQDLSVIHRMLPGKAIWGGVSGPEHLAAGTPEATAKAVETAFSIIGKRGLVLGTGVVHRQNWPLPNLDAFVGAWRRLREF